MMAEATAMITTERAPAELVEVERPIPFDAAKAVFASSLFDRSEKTKAVYIGAIDHFGDWLATRGIEGVNYVVISDLMAYRAHWQEKLDGGEYKPATVAKRLVGVRLFLTHCAVEGFVKSGITKARIATYLKSPKGAKGEKLPVYLDTAEITALLSVITSSRDYALCNLALGSGLRASELVDLRVGDLQPQRGGAAILTVRRGKGNKRRAFRIPPEVFGPVADYVKMTGRSFRRKRDHDTHVFPSRQNAHLTRSRIDQLVKQYFAEAGIERPAHAHVLRHSFATHYCLNEGSVVALSLILGHADVNTSMVYVHLADMVRGDKWRATWLHKRRKRV